MTKPRPFPHRFRSAVLRAQLPPTQKLLLLVLVEFADESGGSCYPALTTVAALAGVNEKTARRELAKPCPFFERVTASGSGKSWRRYGYRLLIPEGADTTPARWAGEGADTTPAADTRRCGHSDVKVRTFAPEGAGVVSDDIGLEIGKSRLAKSVRAKITLPNWLPEASWKLWRQHRGKKFTPLAEELSLKKLTALRDEGHDPVRVVALAVESGWATFHGRPSTKADGHQPGAISRDPRTEDEIERGNSEQLARFGMEDR